MTPKEKVLDRVKKLLALAADGRGATEAEAASAAAKAAALLAEHNLTAADIADVGETVDEVIEDKVESEDSRPWRRPIAGAVARLYFCTYLYEMKYYMTSDRACGYIRKDVHSFIGKKHNTMVARMMFDYLTVTIDKLAREGARSQPVKERASYVTAFRKACAIRLANRIYDMYTKAKRGTTQDEYGKNKNVPALVSLYESSEKAVEAYKQAKYPETGHGRRDNQASNLAGMSDGRKAGDSISLNAQLGTAGKGAPLLGSK